MTTHRTWRLALSAASITIAAGLAQSGALAATGGLADLFDPRVITGYDPADGDVALSRSTCGDDGNGGGGSGGGVGGKDTKTAGGSGSGSGGGSSGKPCTDDHEKDGDPCNDDELAFLTGDPTFHVTDLSVNVTGEAFRLTRAYSSNPAISGDGLLGPGWHASAFLYVTETSGGTYPTVSINDLSFQERTFSSADGTTWTIGGSTDHTFVQSTVTVGSETFATWRLVIPGQRHLDFYRAHAGGGGITATPGHLEGLLLRDQDLHGNSRAFEYNTYGDLLIPPSTSARLARVTLTSGHDTPVKQAEVDFEWIDDDSLANAGRLSRVSVYRTDNAWSSRIETQRVDYLYKASGDGLSSALGTAGDLVDVRRFTRLDNSTTDFDTWRQRVHQYRYHDGSSESTDTDGDDFLETGAAHQIKMVFEPDQIEHFAQQHSLLNDSTVVSCVSGADELLLLDDADPWNSDLTSTKVAELAALVYSSFETSGEKRNTVVYQQASCGCGGVSHTTAKIFQYKDYAVPHSFGDIANVTQVGILVFDGSSWQVAALCHFHYADVGGPRPYLTSVTTEVGSRTWVVHYEYENDSMHRLIRRMSPAVMASFSSGFPSGTPSYTASTTDGVVTKYEYASGTPYLTAIKYRQGNNASTPFIQYLEFEYGVSGKPYLRTAEKRYRDTTSTAADDVEIVSYDYGFHSGSDAIAWVEREVEAELVAENGPGGTYSSMSLFNSAGELAWSKAADESLTKQTFDASTGVVTGTTQNAAYETVLSSWPGSPTTAGWGHTGSEDEIASSYTVDLLGRIIEITSLSNTARSTTSFLRREMASVPAAMEDPDGNAVRQGIPYYATIQLPHVITGGASGEFTGRASRSFSTAGGSSFASQSFLPVADSNGDYSSTTSSALGAERSRSLTGFTFNGQREYTKLWTDLASDDSLVTRYGYDPMGRPLWVKSPSGTYTRTTLDPFSRPTKVEIGTAIIEDGASDNAVVVREMFYDSAQTATQGRGDGHLTLVRDWVDSSTSRDTKHFYTAWGERIKTVNALPPHEFLVYDNLSRVTERGVFSSEPSAINTPLADRGAHETVAYSQRGVPFRTRTSLDPDSASAGYLQSDAWADARGRTLKTNAPGGAVTKTVYDNLGRVVTQFVTDGGGDPAPGAAGSHLAARSVAGDVVLEQTTNRYITDTTLVDLITSKARTHNDDSTTGDLASFTSGTDEVKVITTWTAAYFDDANRRTHTAIYGTNTSGFRYNSGAAPTVTQGSPPTAATSGVIVTEIQYAADGDVDVSIGPDGTKSKSLTDDAGRQIATIENYVDATVTWNSGGVRWQANNISTSAPDEDRVTSFAYNDAGHMVKRVAHLPDATSGEVVQETEYVYGTDASVGSLTLPSNDLESADLLVAIKHPNETTGLADTTAAYVEQVGYDRSGARTEYIDQSGTTHAYSYDALGRMTEDLVSAFGTGVDQFVDRIQFTYDDLGRREFVRSKSGSTIRNAVKFEYDGTGAVASVWQDPDGDVVTSGGSPTLRVQYTYESSPSTANNRFRPATKVYPDGSILTVGYGLTSNLDDRISRPVLLKLGSTDIASYDHLGVGTIVSTVYEEPGVMLDRSYEHDGSTSPGVYPGLDQFGRIVRQLWADTDFDEHDSDPDLPNQPPIVELTHTYDKVGNRLSRVDARPGASWAGRDDEYMYDGLQRLIEAYCGVWNGSSVPTPGVNSQRFTLDALGNITTLETELTGSNLYGDTGESVSRDHNMANELENLDPDDDDLGYSASGNTTSIDYDDPGVVDLNYEYDAWNRLRKIKFNTSTKAEFEYNGLSWRSVYHGDAGEESLSQDREQYYDLEWRLIEERVRSDGEPDPMDPFAIPDDRHLVAQYVWGPRGVDDAVLKRVDTDANGSYENDFYYITDALFSAVALVDDIGTLVERVRYSPYGEARHHWPHDVDGDADADSSDQSTISTLAAANGGAGTPIDEGGYLVEADIDRNGLIGSADTSIYSTLGGAKSALGRGAISTDRNEHAEGPGNTTGWSGYQFNAEAGNYLVRHRALDQRMSRWLSRDPLRFSDGSLLYNYAQANPTSHLDPYGLLTLKWIHGGSNGSRTAQLAYTIDEEDVCNHQLFIGGDLIRNLGRASKGEFKVISLDKTELTIRTGELEIRSSEDGNDTTPYSIDSKTRNGQINTTALVPTGTTLSSVDVLITGNINYEEITFQDLSHSGAWRAFSRKSQFRSRLFTTNPANSANAHLTKPSFEIRIGQGQLGPFGTLEWSRPRTTIFQPDDFSNGGVGYGAVDYLSDDWYFFDSIFIQYTWSGWMTDGSRVGDPHNLPFPFSESFIISIP